MWRYINEADIYWFLKCSFDSNHLEFTVDVDLPLGYVLPNEDRDTSRSTVSIFELVFEWLKVFYVLLIFEECFFEDMLLWGYIYLGVVAVLRN